MNGSTFFISIDIIPIRAVEETKVAPDTDIGYYNMKTTIKIAAMLLLAVALVTMVSCKKDKKSISQSVEDFIIGTWKTTEVEGYCYIFECCGWTYRFEHGHVYYTNTSTYQQESEHYDIEDNTMWFLYCGFDIEKVSNSKMKLVDTFDNNCYAILQKQ